LTLNTLSANRTRLKKDFFNKLMPRVYRVMTSHSSKDCDIKEGKDGDPILN